MARGGHRLMDTAVRPLLSFMELGGDVLWLIGLLAVTLWSTLLERVWYYRRTLNRDVETVIAAWNARADRASWNAKQIRRRMLSLMRSRIRRNLPLIKTLVALCPLLGLLGTVTGMIEVFNVMAVTGGGDARALAGGVSHATIPTMAGMVVALSGIFANTYVSRAAERRQALLEDRMSLSG